MVLGGISRRAKSRASFLNASPIRSSIALVGLLRAIGMPPLFGFWGKIVGLIIIYEHFILISALLIFLSVGIVFIYFRLIFVLIMEKRSSIVVHFRRQAFGVFGGVVFLCLLFI